ncbi:hypothetical protein BDV11DRAFT_216141 [Aspergillus similis]
MRGGLKALVIASLLAVTHAKSWATGTFENPAAAVRPKFRYWLPDAGVDTRVVQADIRSAGSIGAGGVEFLPFYNYGGELPAGGPGPDWATFGFGTEAFYDIFVATLKVHEKHGLNMDFAQGPNQGQGVPAAADDEGLQWDLAPFFASLAANGSFQGIVPGWGTGELVALVSAELLSTRNISLEGTSGAATSPAQSSYLRMTLRNGSLISHIDGVAADGTVQIQRQANASYQLFAFYQYHTLHKNLEMEVHPAATIFDNGSYIVDHFSQRGAQTIIDFWETHLLTPEVEHLLRRVGMYGWEDSVEAQCNISWTPSLPSLFSDRYGYDIRTYLPLIMFRNNNLGLQPNSPGLIQCVLDTPDGGEGYVNDYRGALVLGYRQYLQALTEWMHSRLGLQSSAQVSYNLPMDMAANIPFVDVPECESLGFKTIDSYRRFVGPAALGGRNIVSNEMGAVMLEAYRFPIPSLLWNIHRAVAAGVNRFVLHGQDYTGDYYRTTWPGYTAFVYLFSGQYSHKDPVWDHGFAEALEYIARLQYTQQTAQLRTDVAVYHKASATDPLFEIIYNATDLEDHGYSYNYVSPDNFDLPFATVRDGVLSPDGPAYRALVIPCKAQMSPDAIWKVQTYAQQGLPVILSGGDPGLYPSGAAGSSSIEFAAALDALKKTAHVYPTTATGVAQQLQELGLQPMVEVKSNGTWYAIWREGTKGSRDALCFIFNNADTLTTGTIDVATTLTPYLLDAWTGNRKSLLLYQTIGNRTRIPLTLHARQSVLLEFGKPSHSKHLHATQLPKTVIGYSYNRDNTIQLHIREGSWDSPIRLSDGREYRPSPVRAAGAPFSLTGWTLTVEHWEAPENLSDASVIAVKRNTTHSLASLVSWTEIPSLTNTSGIGRYAARFPWPPSDKASTDGAYIRLPQIIHAARLFVNGKALPALDPTFPQVDISPYIIRGRQNLVQIEAPTTMWNYLRSLIDELTFMGLSVIRIFSALGVVPEIVDNGIIGDVQVVPYTTLRV